MPLTTDDIVETNQLYARYNNAIDSHDGAAFAACFTADGYLDTGMGPREGAEAIDAFVAETAAMLPGLRHLAHNVVVDGDGDSATGSAFLVAYDTSGGHKVMATGRYTDELMRTEQGWRFSRRVFTADS
jgi:uncharacterized protein (TIGR02246 family)